MKRMLCLSIIGLIFLTMNNLYAQDVDSDKVIAYSLLYSSIWYDSQYGSKVLDDLFYDIDYGGKSIEEGIEKFINEHPIEYKEEYGTREKYNLILSFHRNMIYGQESGTKIFALLCLAWNICDFSYVIELLDSSVNDPGNRNKTNKMIEIEFVKSKIKTRAELLYYNHPNKRWILSFFDKRTYSRLLQ
ncbi:hypothetical protein [Treponema primitia]|uniref:hypothetical protein n=1 Tax=Treponema primitia TaxID=88058 RepID=UPI00059FF7E4|nr:hypothetical protein [Treponema primitia]